MNEPLRSLSALSDSEKPDISRVVVDCCFKVHKILGPGLLENAYEQCLFFEMTRRGLFVEKQKSMPVLYENIQIDAGYRLDFLVEKNLILEIKSVDKFLPVHTAQLMTYLKLSKIKTGLLINFNVPLIKEGIKRYSI